MFQRPSESKPKESTRRNFIIQGTSVAAGAAMVSQINIARAAHAYGSDAIRVGLIGCGGRGTGAAEQAMNTSGGDVRLVAMGDAFDNRLRDSEKNLRKRHPNKIDVDDSSRFTGLDAYKKVLESNCDLVILASPPGFRPLHFDAAIEAGKHVFAEKPVACDAPGVRRFLEVGEKAKKKGLAFKLVYNAIMNNATKKPLRSFKGARSVSSSWLALIGTEPAYGSATALSPIPNSRIKSTTGTTSIGSAATISTSNTSITWM